MMVKFKFPAIIFYVDRVKKGKGYIVQGKAMGPIIVIGKLYVRDHGLLAHEYTHVKEWWTNGLLIHNILYGANKHYRLNSECKAYYEQWLLGEKTEIKKQDFTNRIWLFYNLKYPREYIEQYFYKFFPKP